MIITFFEKLLQYLLDAIESTRKSNVTNEEPQQRSEKSDDTSRSSGRYIVYQTINFAETPKSPSETAREIKRAARDIFAELE